MIKEIIQECKKIKREHNSSLYNLLNDNDIMIVPDSTLYDIKAYTLTIKNKNVIVINTELDEYEYNFVLCHEIFHILNHDDTSRCFTRIFNTDRYELQANIFAVVFLDYKYSYAQTEIQRIVNNTIMSMKSVY